MGLDFKGSNASWSYGGFNEFRRRLAKDIGFDLEQMAGFKDIGGISWGKMKDGIKPLLNHSDCDGELTVEEMKLVAPRLKAIVEKWEPCYDKGQALMLAEDMQKLIVKNKPLIFQ